MSMSITTSLRPAICTGLVVCAGLRAEAQANGIYADFTTSMGSFTCRLEYAIAPKAVANFIGLATGQRPWLDLRTGAVRSNAFYEGLTFHRVIPAFMIQGGSPNGLGTDGPGYVFPDEISPALQFDGPGMLAMANSGTNSNGAQFFVTVTNTAWLNHGYTIFGVLVGGSNVVNAIDRVATDANNKPLADVVLQHVGIRRVGAAAQAFDIHTANLPAVNRSPLRIASGNGHATLTFTNQLYAANHLFASTNLTTWADLDLGIEVTPPFANVATRPTTLPREFFRFAQVLYPSSTFAPRSLVGRTLTLRFTNGLTVTIAFNASGAGTYTLSAGPPGVVTGYTWNQAPYRGLLWPVYFSGLVPMTLKLDFAEATSGAFSGTAYTSPASSVSGTFAL